MPKGKTPEETIDNAFQKTAAVLFASKKASVSISGGSDSDIMLDLVVRVARQTDLMDKVAFVFFDTGIEHDATKRHLDYLEERYGINIDRIRAKVPVPLGCKTYGLPFLTKHVSDMIGRLQKANFDWRQDGSQSYDKLIELYPHCKTALSFWCNVNPHEGRSYFVISRFHFLKEFIIENPPDFPISDKCCYGAKKVNGNEYAKKIGADVQFLGLRKSEGGIRAASNTCWNRASGIFKPIFWFDDNDKRVYQDEFRIVHSDCYTKYGYRRTGCCGCPFNPRYKEDLAKIEEAEPNLVKAARNIFGKSYEYTEMYKAFKARMQKNPDQEVIDFGEIH